MMDDLVESTEFGQTTVEADRTIHRIYRGQNKWETEAWIKREELGNGSYGTVWLETAEEDQSSKHSRSILGAFANENTSLGVRAVKQVRKTYIPHDYRKEIGAMAKVRRFPEYFAYLHGWYESGDWIFLAMDYFALGDLSCYLEHKIPEQQVKSITKQLLCGLMEMHHMGITHRDLKPQNVFVVSKWPPAWDVRIGDFGIAKRVLGNETAMRTSIGTKPYMAPEMFSWLVEDEEGHTYTQKVDIWALGILVYQMLTLEKPFGKGNPVPKFYRGQSALPEAPLRTETTPVGVDFIKLLLQPRPKDRPSSENAIDHAWLQEVVKSSTTPLHSVKINHKLTSVDKRSKIAKRKASVRDVPRKLSMLGSSNESSLLSGSASETRQCAPLRYTGSDHEDIVFKDRPNKNGIARIEISNSTPRAEYRRIPRFIGTAHGGRDVEILEGQDSEISAVAFSPNGILLASGSHDGRVILWDMAGIEKRVVARLETDCNEITLLTFSPDGRLLAVGSVGVCVRLYEVLMVVRYTSRAKVTLRRDDTSMLSSMAFSQDGQKIVLGSSEGNITYWDSWETGAATCVEPCDGRMMATTFSPGDEIFTLHSLVRSSEIRMYDRLGGVRTYTLEADAYSGHDNSVTAAACSLDGRLVAMAAPSGIVRIWSIATEEWLGTLTGHEKEVTVIAFSLDGRLLVTGSLDRTIRIWDGGKEEEITRLTSYVIGFWTLAFSPNCRSIAIGSHDRMLRIWNHNEESIAIS